MARLDNLRERVSAATTGETTLSYPRIEQLALALLTQSLEKTVTEGTTVTADFQLKFSFSRQVGGLSYTQFLGQELTQIHDFESNVTAEQIATVREKISRLFFDQPGQIASIIQLGSRNFVMYIAKKETVDSGGILTAEIVIDFYDLKEIADMVRADPVTGLDFIGYWLVDAISAASMNAGVVNEMRHNGEVEPSSQEELNQWLTKLIDSVLRIGELFRKHGRQQRERAAGEAFNQTVATGVANHTLPGFVLVEPPND